jgi:hypothetical protein
LFVYVHGVFDEGFTKARLLYGMRLNNSALAPNLMPIFFAR